MKKSELRKIIKEMLKEGYNAPDWVPLIMKVKGAYSGDYDKEYFRKGFRLSSSNEDIIKPFALSLKKQYSDNKYFIHMIVPRDSETAVEWNNFKPLLDKITNETGVEWFWSDEEIN